MFVWADVTGFGFACIQINVALQYDKGIAENAQNKYVVLMMEGLAQDSGTSSVK